MKIYGVQFDSDWNNKKANFNLVSDLIKKQVVDQNSLIILPEMFATGFCLDPASTTKNEPERTGIFLSELAKKMKSWIMGGMTLPTKDKGEAYNSAVTFEPNGRRISVYKKIHPIPILGEDKVHLEGRLIENLTIGTFNVTPTICYDLRFPELFRSALQSGTNLFVVLGCWPKSRINHWVTLLKARAIENQSYVVGVNRIGKDKDLEYGGRTMVVSPLGEILADGAEREGIVEATIDESLVKDWRAQFPAVKEFIQ